MTPHRLPLAVGLLTLAAAVSVPLATTTHIQYEYTFFQGEYDLGLAAMAPPGSPSLPPNPSGIEQPVFGVLLCPRQAGDAGLPLPAQENGAGGTCPNIVVQTNDWLFVFVCEGEGGDPSGGHECDEVPFAVCIDMNGDGNCRPENPANDDLRFYNCGDNPDGFSFLYYQHTGAGGNMAIFIMQDPACPAMQGSVIGQVQHEIVGLEQCQDGVDNDGNGVIDFAGGDPGCSTNEDDLELTPQCRDGADNDGDVLADWPNDPNCTDPEDPSEYPWTH